MSRVFTWIERHLEECIAGVCLSIMSVLVFYQVVMRYVFHRPTSWSDEIAVYAMLWSVYLSCSWAVRERAHIRVMNLINLFPGKARTAMTVLSDSVWFVFGLPFITWQGVVLDLSLWESRFEVAGARHRPEMAVPVHRRRLRTDDVPAGPGVLRVDSPRRAADTGDRGRGCRRGGHDE